MSSPNVAGVPREQWRPRVISPRADNDSRAAASSEMPDTPQRVTRTPEEANDAGSARERGARFAFPRQARPTRSQTSQMREAHDSIASGLFSLPFIVFLSKHFGWLDHKRCRTQGSIPTSVRSATACVCVSCSRSPGVVMASHVHGRHTPRPDKTQLPGHRRSSF